MQTSIEQLAKSPASETFDDPAFRNLLEDHLTWLINHPATVTVPVTAHAVEIYDFDWIGLLNSIPVQADLQWIVIRMNGGQSLTDLPSELRSLRIPNYEVIQNLVMLNSSTKKIR